MDHYDYIIAGAGAAGLSLALALIQSDISGRSVLIIDRETKSKNDRTWCFWTDKPTGLESILYRSWSKLRFISPSFDREFDLGNYRYHMIRGIDYYKFARQKIGAHAKFDWIQGTVQSIIDTPHGAQVTVDGNRYSGDFVFDSILRPGDISPVSAQYHDLKQHFVGWIIEASGDIFDPNIPVLFDFRTPQAGAMRFVYILPFSPNSALIEYTLFSPSLLSPHEYQRGLQNYINDVLGINTYKIVESEQGIIPMTDRIFERQNGEHILNIGTKGGMVKPSSGYAFLRMHCDSAAVVQSLKKHGHPFDIEESSIRYRWFDTILLQIMLRHPNECSNIFEILFRRNSIQSIFRFLDEDGSWSNDLRILGSLPPYRFLEALIKVKLFQKI